MSRHSQRIYFNETNAFRPTNSRITNSSRKRDDPWIPIITEAVKFPDKIKHRRLLRKLGNKTLSGDCLLFAVDCSVIALNVESPQVLENACVQDIRTHMVFLPDAQTETDRKLIETAMAR